MNNKLRNHAMEQVLNLDQLELQKRKWKSMMIVSGCAALLTLAGFGWALRNWLDPVVRTGDTWPLPMSAVLLAETIGVFAFSIQEWRRTGKRIKQMLAK